MKGTVFSLVWPAIFPSLDEFSDSLHALAIGPGGMVVVQLRLSPAFDVIRRSWSPAGWNALVSGLRDTAICRSA